MIGGSTPQPERRDWAERRGQLAPRRLVRILGWAALLSGLLTYISIIAPHEDRTYDDEYLLLGTAVLLVGVLLHGVSRRSQVGRGAVQGALVLASIGVLQLAWLGMRDLGGIQVILLVLILAIATSIGPGWWAALLTAMMSGGYAFVLATSSDVLGFDKASQWQVVTIALVICVAYTGMVRRELERSHDLDQRLQRERDAEREQYATQLERLNEELRDTSELKSSFVAMASHELRTPLTAIEGFAATMQYRWNDLTDDDKRAFVGVIDAQSQRLGRLVTDLLTVSRIEEGRLVARPHSIDVGEAVQRAIAGLDAVGADVHVDYPDDLRATVDPDHLQQVLVNYLANARTYGGEPITVTVVDEPDRGTVQVVVADEGPGVDEEFVPHLFERFSRAPDAGPRSGEHGGTGLGLSIVEGLAQANAGEAWYEPNEPSGARFCLRVPRSGRSS